LLKFTVYLLSKVNIKVETYPVSHLMDFISSAGLK